MIDRGWKKIKSSAKQIAKSEGLVCAVGIQGDKAFLAAKPYDTKAESKGKSGKKGRQITNVEVGAYHEFGSVKVKDRPPQRSFIRSTIDEKKQMIDSEMKKIASGFYANERTDLSLLLLGEKVKKAMIEKIKSGIKPPLKPKTIKAKDGKSTPLINTGQLWNSLSAQVRKATDFKGEQRKEKK